MLLPRTATIKKYRPKIEVFSTRPNHSISNILLNRSEVACRLIINFVLKLGLKLLRQISIQLSTQGIFPHNIVILQIADPTNNMHHNFHLFRFNPRLNPLFHLCTHLLIQDCLVFFLLVQTKNSWRYWPILLRKLPRNQQNRAKIRVVYMRILSPES